MTEAEKFYKEHKDYCNPNPMTGDYVIEPEDLFRIMEDYHQHKVNNGVLGDVITRYSVSKIETVDYLNVAIVDEETNGVVCHFVTDHGNEYCLDKAEKIVNFLNGL
jgi:hypothetical protein